MPNLDGLPAELFTAIFEQTPLCHRTATVLALTRALPHSPVPFHHSLFSTINLKHPEQVIQLYRRIRQVDLPGKWIQNFSVEAWTADADVIINLVRFLPNLSSLTIFIGPHNFAPEHLEELFSRPISGLRFISLRFRPYVQKASYYQFHKGAYFDSTLLALSDWPDDNPLPVLSIVQDPLDAQVSHRQAFAQPLVFFSLEPLTTLVSSPYLRSLTSLRLRVPSRQLGRFITARPDSLPALQLLDVSTCNINSADVNTILTRFAGLRHLILDECAVLRGELHENDWRDLGKACALAGARRVKEREKKLKAWLEKSWLEKADPRTEDGQMQLQSDTPKIRKGRRGLATATISLREAPEKDSTPRINSQREPVPAERIRIIPPIPSLRSLCVTLPSSIAADRHSLIHEAFETGWIEGLLTLVATRVRLRQSLLNGVVRVTRFVGSGNEGDGLVGLEDVQSEFDEEAFEIPPQHEVWRAPVLCLLGEDGPHVEGCGHSIGREIWVKDTSRETCDDCASILQPS
ncbi:hypothetical protein HGRIS_008449 [Hohenbuehelia grisea]|uniref:F-box protein n=1 Tax=Hohenbuehelia grisea TaxID=104357 RepID=A0ABR3J8G7_9AGAR